MPQFSLLFLLLLAFAMIPIFVSLSWSLPSLCVVLMTLPSKLFNTFLTLSLLQGQTSKISSTYVVSVILYLNKTLYQSYPPSRLCFRKFQLSIDSIQIVLFF
jgi:hypothetical protein